MTWTALNQIAQKSGEPDIDYDRFAARWETDPILKNLVQRFDGNGVVLKTKTRADTPSVKSKEDKKLSFSMGKHSSHKNKR